MGEEVAVLARFTVWIEELTVLAANFTIYKARLLRRYQPLRISAGRYAMHVKPTRIVFVDLVALTMQFATILIVIEMHAGTALRKVFLWRLRVHIEECSASNLLYHRQIVNRF